MGVPNNPQRGVNPLQAFDIYDNADKPQVPSLELEMQENLRVSMHLFAQTVAENNAVNHKILRDVMELLNPPEDEKWLEIPGTSAGSADYWEPESHVGWIFDSVSVWPLDGLAMPDRVQIEGIRGGVVLPLAVTNPGIKQDILTRLPRKARLKITVFSTTGKGAILILRIKRIGATDRSLPLLGA